MHPDLSCVGTASQLSRRVLTVDIGQKLDLAKLPIATGASYNSHSEEHNARCLENTRTALLHDITDWANKKESKSIFWLSGMAGTGKSTIARTIAQLFASQDQLGASFFFKRGEGERGNASRFFTTIAKDLVAYEPGLLPGIRKALDEDSAISDRALKDQFEKLILQPLLGIKQARSHALARVIVIDALDECEQERDIRVILQLFARTKAIQPLPLRILVTSRPELPIRLGFKEMPDGTYQDLILHEVPRSTIEHDIRLFLENELVTIRKARMLSSDWPAIHQILALVELAVPLFIYAATVCRYVGTKGSNPKEYLNKVLGYQKSTFSQLDRTYLPILDQLLSDQEEDEKETWLQAFRDLVGSIVTLEAPLSIVSLASLLQISQEDVRCRLDHLHSVLRVPDSEYVPVRLLHLSFREFLVDPKKQGQSPFWIDEKSTHKKVASRCLELMSRGLHQDICNLSEPGVLRSEIDENIVVNSLLPDMQYACRYWVNHCVEGQQEIIDGDTAHLFLQKHLLHWLEAMSLMKESSRCVHLLDKLQALASVRSSQSTSIILSFLHDAKRFVLRFQSILAEAPLQIYCSALVFAPEASLIRQTFADKVPQRIKILSMREGDWDACHSTLEGHCVPVRAVAFSPDNKLVASGADGTIRLWEATTGMCLSTLDVQWWSVSAVVFSPDGRLVASVSSNHIVQLWEAATGTCQNTLKGHSEGINAVIFSPDGRLVASASDDGTVRLWEAATGMCRGTLEGHSNNVLAVAFSPDSQLVASASEDGTVRLWETATSACRSTLEGHTKGITAVVFLPDGHLVGTVSWDYTIRLWEVATGRCRSTSRGNPFKAITVAFSPDGQLVASASEDGTVRLWETATSACRSTLEGHTKGITAVVFSPNGQLVASASRDYTIRLWEVATGTCQNMLEGHSEEIRSVVFSPDGQLVASASDDGTVRLWDAGIGTRRSRPEGHFSNAMVVAFSPDGQLVASAAWDDRVRLWETATGTCRSTLEGHSNGVKVVTFSPDSQLVASVAWDDRVRLWEAATGTCRSTLEGHSSAVTVVTFSPDNQLIASASNDGTVQMWETATGTCRSTLKGHTSAVTAVAFSPDSQLVASGCGDGIVQLWEMTTGTCRSTLEGHSSLVMAMAFSPDSRLVASVTLVASAAYDYTIRLWETVTGTCCSTLKIHFGLVSAVAFSPDGQLVALVSREGSVLLLEVATWTIRGKLDGHLIDVTAAAFSPDGQVLHTNQGDISLSPFLVATPPLRQQKQTSHILVQGQWILRNQQRFLWLPPECRSTSAVLTDMVCLGLSSGCVVLLRIL
jgi:WD40 repeat protein